MHTVVIFIIYQTNKKYFRTVEAPISTSDLYVQDSQEVIFRQEFLLGTRRLPSCLFQPNEPQCPWQIVDQSKMFGDCGSCNTVN